MSSRSRSFIALLAAMVAAVALAACGGGSDGEQASASSDVDELLRQTFSGDKRVESGKLAVDLRIDAKGAGVQGPITVKLSGPFQSQGDQRLPKFALAAAFSGQGQDLKAGITSTGDKAFVNFNGTDYAASDQVFRQFQTGYEEAQKQAAQKQNGKGTSLATLGIDPTKWLTNPKNEGDAKVGDADTIKITGGVDVPRLLDDVNTALAMAPSLGVQGAAQLPERLTDEQKQEIGAAVKDLKVEIYTGKEDKILRRMVVDLAAQAPAGSSSDLESAVVKLDLSLTELDEQQAINAPASTKPLDDLLEQFGGLGGGSSSGGGGASSADKEKLEKYTDCVTDAGSDRAEAQKCAELLR